MALLVGRQRGSDALHLCVAHGLDGLDIKLGQKLLGRCPLDECDDGLPVVSPSDCGHAVRLVGKVGHRLVDGRRVDVGQAVGPRQLDDQLRASVLAFGVLIGAVSLDAIAPTVQVLGDGVAALQQRRVGKVQLDELLLPVVA
ncbi:MAG: hypothetical protein AAF711_04995 [Planctomycetota bacterium]